MTTEETRARLVREVIQALRDDEATDHEEEYALMLLDMKLSDATLAKFARMIR